MGTGGYLPDAKREGGRERGKEGRGEGQGEGEAEGEASPRQTASGSHQRASKNGTAARRVGQNLPSPPPTAATNRRLPRPETPRALRPADRSPPGPRIHPAPVRPRLSIPLRAPPPASKAFSCHPRSSARGGDPIHAASTPSPTSPLPPPPCSRPDRHGDRSRVNAGLETAPALIRAPTPRQVPSNSSQSPFASRDRSLERCVGRTVAPADSRAPPPRPFTTADSGPPPRAGGPPPPSRTAPFRSCRAAW